MADRLTTCLASALVCALSLTQLASCIDFSGCGERPLVESGEYKILNLYGQLSPDYEDLVGAKLIIDRDTETSTIRYTRDGTTYEVRHALDAP
ncbi:hypothetical protein [Enhygromyxa salina]|uniref:hypothetical protein n=1 Tax=Enhygromyxa salina TaxID=215803 RepID=UPI0011BAC84B|nr:hypothetical protein [Enhygromyxa salina]